MSRYLICIAFTACLASMVWSQEPEGHEPADTIQLPTDSVIKRGKLIEKVTVSEVKRFLDPTRMVNRIEYDVQATDLAPGARLYRHQARAWIALNNSHAIWLRIPYVHLSMSSGSSPSDFGDVSLGK